MAIESINPANGKSLRTFEALTKSALEQKLAAAEAAFVAYQKVPLEHRALCMRKLAMLLTEEKAALAKTITLEMGKPLTSAAQEVEKCAAACLYYAEHAQKFMSAKVVHSSASRSYIRWEPLGVVLAVMPWNFPFWQVFRFLAPALMAGNAGLLKHAPNVPQCALAIEELVRRAGFLSGIFQSLLIETSQVEYVLADERVVAVTLTGSEAAGQAIAAQAGWLLKKTVMELGGSDPFVVMASANLQRAVETAVKARSVNAGQSCIAAKRFIVQNSIYEEFLAKFVEQMDALVVGDPMKAETQIGPLVSERALQKLEAQVQAAVEAGGRILCGGERLVGDGFYYEPTVIAGVSHGSAIYREEIFGPVAMVFCVKDTDEAIALANDTPFGLGASVWTQEPVEQKRFVAEIQAGMVFLNAMVASEPALPFGGIKRSGYGRELGAAGMREFMNAKSVYIG